MTNHCFPPEFWTTFAQEAGSSSPWGRPILPPEMLGSKTTSPWQLVEDRRMKGWIDSLEHQKTPTTTLAPWETMELTSCFGGKAPWDLVRADDHCELSTFVSVLKRFWEQFPVETTWWFRKRCYCKWKIDENCWQIFWHSLTAFLFFGYDNQFADAVLVGSCSAAKSLANSSIHQGFRKWKSFGNGTRVNTLQGPNISHLRNIILKSAFKKWDMWSFRRKGICFLPGILTFKRGKIVRNGSKEFQSDHAGHGGWCSWT